MNKYLVIAVIALLLLSIGLIDKNIKLNREYETAMSNVQVYSDKANGLDGKCTALKLTVEQLESYSDSVLEALNKTREELKVKDKNLKALQYIKTSFSKRDTITLRDTIFSDPAFSLDTTLSDEWYKMNLGLRYPSSITVEPEFKSEKHIIVSLKRQTVKPPKKCFLLRWFQKKMTVVHVDVEEKNPYMDNQVTRYIEIIK